MLSILLKLVFYFLRNRTKEEYLHAWIESSIWTIEDDEVERRFSSMNILHTWAHFMSVFQPDNFRNGISKSFTCDAQSLANFAKIVQRSNFGFAGETGSQKFIAARTLWIWKLIWWLDKRPRESFFPRITFDNNGCTLLPPPKKISDTHQRKHSLAQ